MEVSYKKEMDKNTMIIKVDGKNWSDYETEMFYYNSIRTFLSFYVLVEDGQISFIYDTTEMESISDHIKRSGMSQREFGLFIISIRRALRGVETYMLNEKSVVFDPNYVFVDKSCRKFKFCYLPGAGNNDNGNFKDKIKSTVGQIVKKDKVISPWVANLSKRLEGDGFDLLEVPPLSMLESESQFFEPPKEKKDGEEFFEENSSDKKKKVFRFKLKRQKYEDIFD